MSFQNCHIMRVNADSRLYHEDQTDRGEADFLMSSSAIRAFDQCPARWLKGYNPPDSEAKDFGNLLDCTLLTPNQFEARYAVQPFVYDPGDGEKLKKWNNNATVCREWTKAQTEAGREVITVKEETNAITAAKSVLADEVSRAFIESSDKQVWVAGEWLDENTGLVIPCKCLIDLVPHINTEHQKCLGDLKTTRNAETLSFSSYAQKVGYHIQAAWNLDMYVAATGEDRCSFSFLLVENYPPWQASRKRTDPNLIESGKHKYEQAMRLYAKCLATGFWPGYDNTDEADDQGWGVIRVDPYKAEKAMFGPQWEVEEDEDELEPQHQSEDVPT